MSAFDAFYFIDETVSRLRLGVCGEKSCHAYLFCGPEGVGKKSLASICARAVNCLGDGDKPCDVCASCAKYLSGSYPDHITVQYAGKALGVAAVRDLIERLGFKAFEGGFYTVILERADMMTAQAQNALLKTLEDPPSKVVFFLLAENEQALLPTIKSRCRLIRMSPLSVGDCALALEKKGFDSERALLLSRVSQGSVGKALSIDADSDYWDIRKRVISVMESVNSDKDISVASSRLKEDSSRAGTVLEIIEQISEMAMRGGEGMNDGGEARFALDSQKLLCGCITARRMLASNVAWQPVLEKLLFEALD